MALLEELCKVLGKFEGQWAVDALNTYQTMLDESKVEALLDGNN